MFGVLCSVCVFAIEIEIVTGECVLGVYILPEAE
jgi:hypothetical protein